MSSVGQKLQWKNGLLYNEKIYVFPIRFSPQNFIEIISIIAGITHKIE